MYGVRPIVRRVRTRTTDLTGQESRSEDARFRRWHPAERESSVKGRRPLRPRNRLLKTGESTLPAFGSPGDSSYAARQDGSVHAIAVISGSRWCIAKAAVPTVPRPSAPLLLPVCTYHVILRANEYVVVASTPLFGDKRNTVGNPARQLHDCKSSL